MKYLLEFLSIMLLLSWLTGCVAGAYSGNNHLIDGGFASFCLMCLVNILSK